MKFDLRQFDGVEVDLCVEFWLDNTEHSVQTFTESYSSEEEFAAEPSIHDIREKYWAVFLRYKDGGDMHGLERFADFVDEEQAALVGYQLERMMERELAETEEDVSCPVCGHGFYPGDTEWYESLENNDTVCQTCYLKQVLLTLHDACDKDIFMDIGTNSWDEDEDDAEWQKKLDEKDEAMVKAFRLLQDLGTKPKYGTAREPVAPPDL
jgi:hypothetical protein